MAAQADLEGRMKNIIKIQNECQINAIIGETDDMTFANNAKSQ